MRESSSEIYNFYKMEPNVSEIHKNDFLMHDLEPCSVLYSSKMGRVVLVQNKRSKRRYVLKYIYRWKLVKFNEDEKLLKVLYMLARFVGAAHPEKLRQFRQVLLRARKLHAGFLHDGVLPVRRADRGTATCSTT